MLADYSNAWKINLSFINIGVAVIGFFVLVAVTWILIRGEDRVAYRRYWWPWRLIALVAVVLLAWFNAKVIGSTCHGVCA
jgi:hypothetical protein